MIHETDYSSKVRTYELTVKTGVWPGAGTTANVPFVIYGVEGNSGNLKMPETCGNDSKQNFVRGTQQKFLVILKKDIGEIYSYVLGMTTPATPLHGTWRKCLLQILTLRLLEVCIRDMAKSRG